MKPIYRNILRLAKNADDVAAEITLHTYGTFAIYGRETGNSTSYCLAKLHEGDDLAECRTAIQSTISAIRTLRRLTKRFDSTGRDFPRPEAK